MVSGTWCSFEMNADHPSGLDLIKLGSSLLSPLSLSLTSGSCLTIYGPSGAGKTLLLRAIADLDVNQGDVLLNGESRHQMPADQWRRQVMYFPADSHWWSEKVHQHAVEWDEDRMQALNLPLEILDQPASRLSSGERQRLALLRGLSYQPRVLLLDEPTANLDRTNTLALETLIQGLLSSGLIVIWITHDREQRQRIGSQEMEIQQGHYGQVRQT